MHARAAAGQLPREGDKKPLKRAYEIAFLFRTLAEDELQAALDQVVNWIENPEEDRGKVTRIDRNLLGRRKLAYEIDGQREGIYILVYADIEPEYITDLEYNLKLFNPLLRFLVVRDEPARLSQSARRKQEAEQAEKQATSAERVVPVDPRQREAEAEPETAAEADAPDE